MGERSGRESKEVGDRKEKHTYNKEREREKMKEEKSWRRGKEIWDRIIKLT